MSEVVPFTGSPHVPPVETELLASAVFLFTEYLEELSRDAANDEEAPEESPEIDTRAMLDLISGDLGTSVAVTLALFLRVTALFRLLACLLYTSLLPAGRLGAAAAHPVAAAGRAGLSGTHAADLERPRLPDRGGGVFQLSLLVRPDRALSGVQAVGGDVPDAALRHGGGRYIAA